MTDDEIDALHRALQACGLTQITPGTWGLRMPDGSMALRSVMTRADLRALTREQAHEHLDHVKGWITAQRQS
jgi:hypothetical protein